MAGHDPDLAFTWTNDSRTVGTNQTRLLFAQVFLHLDHVERRNPFSDADDDANTRIGSFHDGVSRKGRRHVNHRRVRARLLHRIGHRVEDWNPLMRRAALTGRHTTNDIGPVLEHLFRMERSFLASNALYDQARRFIDKNAHKNDVRYQKLATRSEIARAQYSKVKETATKRVFK